MFFDNQNEGKMIKDMTRGDALRLIVLFAIPIFIGNVFQQFYQLADIYIVGHLIGEKALAAVGASAPIYFMFLIVAFSFTGGLTAVTAQRFGAKDFEGMRRSVTHSIRASLVLSVVLTLVLFVVLKRLMMVLNVPEGIFEESYRFILILGAGTILIVALNLLSGFIRAAGDSRTPLFFLVFTSVLNVVFNFVLIKYCGFGVEGSAFGTVLSILVSDVLCLWYMFKKFPLFRLKKGDWAFSWAFMREHLNIAVPMSIQYSILALSIMVIQAVCNSFGEKVIVGFTIALRFEQLATQPLMAIGLAMATFAAQNFGAGLICRIKRTVKKTVLLSLGLSVFLSVLVFFLGPKLIGSFMEVPNSDSVRIGAAYLNISIMFYFFLGIIFIFKNTLQSVGKPFYPVISGVVELGVRSFAAIILARHIGYEGIYWASPLAWLSGAMVVALGYYLNFYYKKDTIIADYKAQYQARKAA